MNRYALKFAPLLLALALPGLASAADYADTSVIANEVKINAHLALTAK